MYRGSEPIDGAATFIHTLNKKGIPYLFLTNNSTSTQEAVAQKLIGMGIDTTSDHVFSSILATAKYIKQQNAQARFMVIGDQGHYDVYEIEGCHIGYTWCYDVC